MKKIILNKYNVIITFLLSLLGITTSCELGDGPGGPVAEYGVPSATFKVAGRVTTENLLPIEGIRVVMFPDTTYTNATGAYQVVITDLPKDHNFTVEFKDVDGSTNGSYLEKDSVVSFIDNQYQNGSGTWYVGEVTKNVDVKLKEE